MSAYVVVQRPDAVHVLTDGLSYTREGVVAAITSKCGQLGPMPAVITTRGPADLQEIIAEFAASVASAGADFDWFIDAFPSLMEHVHGGLVSAGRRPEFEVVVAGWSATQNRLVVYSWENHGRRRTEGSCRYKLVELTSPLVMAPVPSDPDLLAAGWNPALRWNAFDPERDGLTIMEAQRRFRSTEDDHVDPGLFFVGGRVTLTTITRHGIVQKPIKDFADTIGQKIRPELSEVPGSRKSAGVNRQQRRAIDRHDRRQRAAG